MNDHEKTICQSPGTQWSSRSGSLCQDSLEKATQSQKTHAFWSQHLIKIAIMQTVLGWHENRHTDNGIIPRNKFSSLWSKDIFKKIAKTIQQEKNSLSNNSAGKEICVPGDGPLFTVSKTDPLSDTTKLRIKTRATFYIRFGKNFLDVTPMAPATK